MKLIVENLGAITEGEISLNKDIILFTGKNNTGKSYLTYIIHAILSINNLPFEKEERHDKVHKILQNSKYIKDRFDKNEFIYINDIIDIYKQDFGNLFTNIIKTNLTRIFASNKINPEIKFNFDKIDQIQHTPKIAGFIHKDGDIYIVWENDRISGKPLSQKQIKEISEKNNKPLHLFDVLLIFIDAVIDSEMFERPPFGKPYIFPSERTAINLFARDIVARKAGSRDDIAVRVLSGEDISEIAKSLQIEQNISPKYPLAINDYLNFVNSFEGSNTISKYNKIANTLEKSILGGSISLSEFKQVVFTPFNTKHHLSLHESSSLIKSLSFLVIYLRHFANEGDWIIIDEPEINLHPNLQRKVARIFAQMANSGLKIIISTHSDYLIKEFNTLVLLKKLNTVKRHKSYIKQNGYNEDDLLDSNKVGAHYLEEGKIKTIDVEGKGISVPSINETIAEIDNLTEEVFFKLSTEGSVKKTTKTKKP